MRAINQKFLKMLKPNSIGTIPLYMQVCDLLEREVNAKIRLDGERLPPERILAKELGIAVGTLRLALAELTRRGMLERIQGSGNYIRHKSNRESVYAFFHLELIDGIGDPSAELISASRIAKPENLPDIGGSDTAHRIRRVRHLGDVKVALEEIWIDGTFDLDDGQNHMSHSLYQLYKEHLGFWIAKVEDSVSVAPMPDWGQPLFNQSDQEVWGFCERLAWDQHGQLVEASSTWFDPAKARYRARWK